MSNADLGRFGSIILGGLLLLAVIALFDIRHALRGIYRLLWNELQERHGQPGVSPPLPPRQK